MQSGDDGGVTVIVSTHNPRVQAAVALRDRRARATTGLTLVDGARECSRALTAGVDVETAFTCPALLSGTDADAVIEALRSRGISPTEVSDRVLETLAFGDRADGIVLVVRPPATNADAAGCTAVIAIGGTDLFNPNVIRASVGTAFSMPLATATAVETLAWLRGNALRIVAARVDAGLPYDNADLRGRLAIVLGSEANGLGADWDAADVEAVRLPMHGVADSLNVSATAAILAFEARRQRGADA
ncbi:MAG: tRNA/rRNA methyltransferase (SpoU) [Chloroflexi bacterium]|nr:tRNA/rRNA methyltransferase (SpoU) [Chloroflexota bacterium]